MTRKRQRLFPEVADTLIAGGQHARPGRRRKLANFIRHPIFSGVLSREVHVMVLKLSPQFFGQPQMSAQNLLDARVVDGEVGGDSFQSLYARPLRGIGALVNHEDSVRSSLACAGTEEGQRSRRSDLIA